jgi:hypothetical protein
MGTHNSGVISTGGHTCYRAYGLDYHCTVGLCHNTCITEQMPASPDQTASHKTDCDPRMSAHITNLHHVLLKTRHAGSNTGVQKNPAAVEVVVMPA